MSQSETDFLDEMIAKKETESPFLKLAHIGDSAIVFRVMEMGPLEKVGFGGKRTTALAFKFLVDVGAGQLVEKTWDNSSMKTFTAVRKAGIKVGSSFTITRGGKDETTNTQYEFTNVVNPPVAAPKTTANQAAAVATPVAPAKPTVAAGAAPAVPVPGIKPTLNPTTDGAVKA